MLSPAEATYRTCGFFLLRAPALPVHPLLGLLRSLPAGPPSGGWEHDYAEGLLKLWALPEVATAIRSVAPDLAAAVDRIDDLSARDRRRAVAGLGRYVNRMSVRATPLDLVAGVAGGSSATRRRRGSRIPPSDVRAPGPTWAG